MNLETWSHYCYWKSRILVDLNNGYFSKSEWLEFIASATDAGMVSMASDMQSRLDNYTKGEQDD